MSAPRLSRELSRLKNREGKRGPLEEVKRESRRLQMEFLEDRRVMAVGPSLVSVIPNSGVFLRNQDTLTVAPREITFRFAQGNSIDPASLASGIKLVRSGVDGVFDAANATTKNDIVITPGFVGLGDTPREVVMRFASNLPDDLYRITLVGLQPAGTTSPPLRDTSGNPFTVNGVAANQNIDFNLDLGTKVEAVVPQPITRGATGLTQSFNTIDVYFDSKELNADHVRKPSYYRLIDSTTGFITLPNSVSAPLIDTATGHSKVTLSFASGAIAGSTYKLEVGATTEPLSSGTPDFKIAQALHLGNSMSSAFQAYVGDNLTTSANPFDQRNDVDMYRFELKNDVTDFTVRVTPGTSLNAAVRIFDNAGNPVALPEALIDGQGAGGQETATIALAAGTYFVGVSSSGNVGYSAGTGSTNATGGNSVGSYSIQVTFSDLVGSLDDTSTSNNSSYDTATDVGTLGSAGRNLAGSISPAPDPLRLYDVQFPGAGDAPGERILPFQQHITTVPGRLPDPTAGIQTVTYDFQTVYGFTPQGQQFSNAINEAQKQRTREVLELYGRYLGVQFQEVPDEVVADMTVATGDPRAVAPTISTGTGYAGTGVNGISGTAVVPSNSDVLSNAAITKLLTSRTAPISNAVFSSVNNNLGAAVALTSVGHGLRTGDYVRVTGVLGTTSSNGVWQITVLDQDRFALNNSASNGNYLSGGTWTQLNISRGVAIANALVNWTDPNLGGAGNNTAGLGYGGQYFQTIMHQVGHLLGLGDNFEAPAPTIMGAGETLSQAANRLTAERIFPGDADIVYGQTVQRPESRDIDLYRFVVTEPGLFRAETIAERLANSSLLNTQLTLYRETTVGGVVTRTEVARNDDYYGNDSYLELKLSQGTYYLSVTSTGMTEMNPTVLDSGFGGRTQGSYNISMSLKPDGATTPLRDGTSGAVAFDGDGDGTPGGAYQFYFQSNTVAATSEIIYVDKASTVAGNGTGAINNPFKRLDLALDKARQVSEDPASTKTLVVVRIVGNDSDQRDQTTQGAASFSDNRPYLVGFKDAAQLQPMDDGGEFIVPKNVTVMIDAGAMFKMRRANLNAGTTPQGLVSKAGGSIQVLGTPNLSVRFTSYNDDTMGGDSNGPGQGPLGGDYGGIVHRDDSDHERDFLAGVNPTANKFGLTMPVYLNYVNHATMTYGGGKVTVDSVEETYDPIYVNNARPTISFNTITLSANAAISANPNAFDDDGLVPQIAFDDRRIGLDVNNNVLSVTTVVPPATPGGPSTTVISTNSLNGLFVRIRTQADVPLDFVDLPTRWDATDIPYIVSENLEIAGTPGGSKKAGSDRAATTLTDGRLRIDPGALVKLFDAKIESRISSQLIAEGTSALPIVFTSVADDRFGAGGTFDTNKDGSLTAGAPGQWGGLFFGPTSSGSLDEVKVFYAGGLAPISGGLEDNFNAVEIHQADVRIANSLFQFNAAGAGTTDRSGRGTNAAATIFVRGAQPVVTNNTVRDNAAAVISIDANSMKAAPGYDTGRSTGAGSRNSQYDGNYGPLVRGNRLSNNAINGMEVRGGVLTTETVWDDTDIVHVLRSEITVLNHQVYSGLRLQSSAQQSLVVKLQGANAGFTADGIALEISDRIGGTVQIVGQPGRPVILTSLADDTVSASLDPTGLPQFDTNNNAAVSAPAAGDWRSVNLEQLSNDTNAAAIIENEPAQVGISGQLDNSRTPQKAQFLGTLAKDVKSGDDTRRLGFQVNGAIAYDYALDVDVYSFNADSGTEVWIDIDSTSYGLDAMVELVDTSGNVLARATNTLPDAPISNPADPGLNPNVPGGLAQSFNKDPYNGRDTFSTNASASVVASTGTITDASSGFPIIITSNNHGLVTGDRVVVADVLGNTAANGNFTITRIDSNHFSLDNAMANGAYVSGGTWTRLVTATRDPIMRIVLPNGAAGQSITGPWFVRVRSEPKTLEGAATGNTVNPGQTSGAYQLQVRTTQKDLKPGSTVRFADLRYATNAIEVHGLPSNSPLAGSSAEADDTTNDAFAGAQNLGNLLKTDNGTLSVGGQLSSATDVDWYRFDLNFDLLQFVNGYSNGLKSWSTIFDLDYGDGLSRADTTISVFDSQGTLILTGRDSDVQDDQAQETSALANGSFGKHDPLIGPAQLPARVPGQQAQTYYVAVSSDRMLPTVLDQTFSVTPTDSNVRLEPVESVARVASDPLEAFFIGAHTSAGGPENPSNLYYDPNNPFQQPGSTLVDTRNTQSLTANVKPFTLADVPLFVSQNIGNQDRLYNVDATVGQRRANATSDFQTTGFLQASAQTTFGTGNLVTLNMQAVAPGAAGNSIVFNFASQDLNNGGVPIIAPLAPGSTAIDITLDTQAAAIQAGTATVGTTANQLEQVMTAHPGVNSLVTFSFTGASGTDISQYVDTLFFSGGSNSGGIAPNVMFTANNAANNNISITFNRVNRGGAGANVAVNGNLIIVNLDTNIPQGNPPVQSGTTVQQMINAIRAFPEANALVSVTQLAGSPSTDIANATNPGAPQSFNIALTGGSAGIGSIEVQYNSRVTSAVQNDIADLSFRADGVLFGYEGVNIPGVTNTAGRLVTVDPGTGTSTSVGNDNIPDQAAAPPAQPTVQSFNEITTNLAGGQAGMAWGGTTVGGIQNTDLYYTVPDPAGASRLYFADPNNGSAQFQQNQPWGRVGGFGGTSPTNGLITQATAARGTTRFDETLPAPTPPVTVAFQTREVGAGASGRIHFTASRKGVGVKPTITYDPLAVPEPLMSVDMNLDPQQASATVTFADATNATDVTFTAGPLRIGDQGNNVQIEFVRANLNGQGPTAVFIPASIGGGIDIVRVTLDTSRYNGTDPQVPNTQIGTSAYQLQQLINNDPQLSGIVVVNAGAVPNVLVSTTTPGNIRLAGGGSATTAQALVEAINAFQFNGSQVIQANVAGGLANTVVALENKTYVDVLLVPGAGSVGFTTGIAFGGGANAGTLYGVTTSGQFLVNVVGIVTSNGAAGSTIDVSIPDPSNPTNTLSGANGTLRFAALTRGPQNVENGRFANMFFAITDTGVLTALNTSGVPQQIFDVDGDGTPDSVSIATGIATGVTGLAFSPFDFNLWHPTFQRQDDAGHSMGGRTGLNTSPDNVTSFPSSGRGQDVNMSMYFGFETWLQNPGYLNDSYQTYTGAQPLLGTNNALLANNGGQLGIIDANQHRELSTNTGVNNTYDLPGGAYGILQTGNFSLAGLSSTDKPTLYFDYFLDTQDANVSFATNQMRDSARIYVGPFTRFDASGGPYITGAVSDPNSTATQFSAVTTSSTLSTVNGFYKGKAVQFNTGVLAGETRLIADYIGATRTFVFTDGFSAAPGLTDTFSIANGYQTWDLLATNNSTIDNPNSGQTEGELPTFISTSATAHPDNPRQQVQLLHDNTGVWRQARVDLSRYAGMTNLQVRFDFSTAGEMATPSGHLPPNSVAATQPGQDYLVENAIGNLQSAERGQDNVHEGFYVDNIIIGAAERGEMVINAPANNAFTDLHAPGSITQPQNLTPGIPVPTQVLSGEYQLEIRRGAEYGIIDNGPLSGINASNTQTPVIVLDTNDRLIADQRPATPIPLENFETGDFSLNLGAPLVPNRWSSTDDASWTVVGGQVNPNDPNSLFTAASGTITNGQRSGLSIDLITGQGDLTFDISTDTETGGDFLRLYIDGRLANYTAIDGVSLSSPLPTQWSGQLAYMRITVPVSAGHHNFRWSYEKDESISLGGDRVFLDNIQFPTPQVGFQNIYQDTDLHQPGNPNAVNPPIGPTIPPPTSFGQIHFIDTLYGGMVRTGDENQYRPQGHIQIEQNQIDRALAAGILIDSGDRDPVTGDPAAAVRNLPTLNNDRLLPGVTVVNNIISNFGQTGINFAGDSATFDPVTGQWTVNGQVVPAAAVSFGRILNNSIWGGSSATGIGINVGANASPTIINNIVANTSTGIVIDPTSTTTDSSFNLFSGNGTNGPTGSNAIVLAAGAPLFKDPNNRNFYLAQGSLAVDSSRDSAPDRNSIAAVKSAVGIPASNVIAPSRDVFGQLRLDDAGTPNTGAGQSPFYDRGALERADFLGPTASISDPLDNDSLRRDRNPLLNEVAIRNEDLQQFAIKFSDVGVNIDPTTVTASQFTIFVDASLTPLLLGTDYTFNYNPATQEAVFTPTSGIWAREHTYTIKVRNVPTGTVDALNNPIPPGVLDLAGNPLAPNQPLAAGQTLADTSFKIFVGTLYDFGDAPNSFTTLFTSNGPAHVVFDDFYLGAGVSEEREAKVSTNADGDDLDNSDGIRIINLTPSVGSTGVDSNIEFNAVIPSGKSGFIDAWFDLNADGDFLDAGEKVIEHQELVNGLKTVTFRFGDSNTQKREVMARFRFSSGEESRLPTGIAPDGEVVDQKVRIAGPPYQNPNLIWDVNNSGKVSPIDALTIINYLNAYRPLVSGQNISLPPQAPLPFFAPEGQGPGRALYMDVSGDTFLAPNDAQLVIEYINSQLSSGSGEGEARAEGEGAASFATSAEGEGAAAAVQTALAAPLASAAVDPMTAVLYASSSIVLEAKAAASTSAQHDGTILDLVASNQSNKSAEELALLALSGSSAGAHPMSLAQHAKLKTSLGPVDEASWEDLLADLAADQEDLYK